ncbi:MAG: glycine zipper 2TM domain-containing protein [Gammaproteobacteria bacterium]|nr:glycine zipper 2TM domain-containing protein [Gammaproteobacteria bacterium]MDH3450308.1 glycine zipper 2TM domain-containing protein [Gammaproteobacteria bacterium]
MKALKTTIAVTILVFAGAVSAGGQGHKSGHKKHDYAPRQDLYDFARVVDVRPIYRKVKVSTPVRECWEEPVYHTRQGQPKSAGGMLAGGLIGGIIGHQIGKGRGNKVATAVGTLIGAQIGHEAVNGHAAQHSETIVGYEERCDTRYQTGFEEIVDGYDVTYQYRGNRYHIEMPYDPGKRIKMRIQITPVI